MAKLYFKVASDWEEVVRLRNEITKLKQELKNMDSTQSPAAFVTLNTQLAASTQRMDELVTKAAKAGAVMEGDFKKKIFDASQTVNGFTEKIISQKAVVKDVEADVRRLGDAYRTALKRNPLSASGKLEEYKSAKRALDEEKAALFGLTQQQANARLAVKKLRDEYSLYNSDGKQVIETNKGIGLSLGKALGVIGGIAALKQLGSEIIRVRGEFQSMQTAIETMVGKDVAGKIMPQIKELAKISPLTMTDMVGAEKMMLGFNIQAEDTIKYLKALSDISMGESSKFNSLTLAFSQMSAAGKLMGQDLNQMINAGFNPLQVIAEKTGKSIATLKEEMSKGAISAEMVQQAFIDATSAGGKFYGMSENASQTINGQISMMQDAWDNALNEIGKSSEGFIMSGIQATTSLIQNYETVGKVLVGLIATYGTYRTAVITNIALTRGWAVAARADGVAKGMQTIATKAQTVAQLALNSAMKANPYVLAATLVVGVVSAMWAFHDSTTEAEKAQKRFNERQKEAAKQEQEHKQKIDSLVESARDIALADLQRGESLAELRREYPKIFAKYDIETIKLADILKLKRQIADEDARRAGEKKQKELTDVESEIKYYENLLKSLSGQQGVDGYVKKLKELRADRDVLLQEKGKGISEQFIASLKGADMSSFDRYITELEKRIKGKGEKGKVKLRLPIDAKGSLSDEAIYDVKDIKTLIDTAKTAKKTAEEAAKAEKKTGKEWLDYYKEKYEEADKAYNDFLKSKTAMSDADRDKELKRLKGLRDTAKKTYESKGGVVSSSSKQESEAEKQRKKQQKSAEELLSLRRQNQQDEINLMKDGSDKKLKQIELDYQKELDAIKKQERAWSKEQGGKLTQEQSVEISTRYTNAESKKDKSTTDLTKEQLKEEQQALNDYLKEYGTFQQQKLAIAQEYAEKIKKAQEKNNGAQVKLLEKQRDVAIQNKETEAIKANIDWVTVFGEFGGMFNDMIRPALEEAKKYVKTDEFKNSDQASQNALIDAIRQMEKSLGGTGGLNFKKLGQDMQVYQSSLQVLNDAKEEETVAIEKLKKAQEDYEKALKSGTEEEKQAAQDARDIAQQNADAASSNVKTQSEIAIENQQVLTDTASNLRANMENVTDGLSKLASGGVKNAYDGLMHIGKGAGGAMEKLADKLDKVPIIGWIISIIDVFKDGLSDFVGTLLDSVFNAVSGILSDVLSGDFFVTLGKSLRDGIGSILNSITFGGWNSWMDKISGSNAKEVQEAIDRLTSRNETLEKSIDRLSDIMDKTAGSKSISAYKQAYQYQQEQNANTLQIAREQAGYHSAHHSWQYYMGWTDEQLQWARNNVDQNFSGTDSLWNLSPEQMRLLLSNADIYDQIKSAGKGGYGESVMVKLEAYANNAEKLDELTTKINESLMQVSFDSLRDSFLDSLMDMNKDAKEFSDDFSEYMQRALLNFSLGEKFDDELKGWYNGIAELMKKQNGKLTEKQLEDARRAYDSLVQDAMAERDKIAEITGYTGDSSSSQESTKKGFAAASQDSIEELNGRFTALQIAGEEIKNQNIAQSQSLNILTVKADSILLVNTESRNIADEIRTIQVNSYLELQEIRENTGAIIKPIKDMAADIAEVKKNTSKL